MTTMALLLECERCGKAWRPGRAPVDDTIDCFCQRCPICDELALDTPPGEPCSFCEPDLYAFAAEGLDEEQDLPDA